MAALFTVLAIGLVYTILYQIYTYNINPWAITEGTDATNLGYIETAWTVFPMIIMLAYAWGLISEGRQQNRSGGII